MSILASTVWDNFWGVLLWMLIFFLFFMWIYLAIQVIMDIFARHISGWAKAAWCFGILFFPFLGVLVYLIFHGEGMTQRQVKQAEAQQDATTAYIRHVAGTSTGPADQLKALKEMHDSGQLTDAEYEKAKDKVLN